MPEATFRRIQQGGEKSLRAIAAGIACFIVIGLPVAGASDPPDPVTLLPDRVLGYAPQEKDGVYTFDTLFDLIDGGAEVYRAFNVGRVVSRRYAKAGAPDIIADLFDMGSSRDAFGVYHHDMREGKDAGMGHESELAGGALAFWKDRYFVSIVAFDESAETERAMLALGRAIDGRIPLRGDKPGIVHLLPRQGLRTSQLIYFHDWTYLNTRYALADENLLHLGRDTEGVLARYRPAGRSPGGAGTGGPLLMLVRYPSTERATAGLETFLAGHLSGADRQGIARQPDGTWAAAQRDGNLVVVVLDAAGRRDVERLMVEAKKTRGRQESGDRVP